MALPEGFPAIDFDQYHRVELPALLARGRGDVAARAAQGRGSIALRLPDGAAYTYRAGVGGVEITAGDADAATVLELDAESWQGLVHELEAPAGLLYAGRVRCVRGDAIALMSWESALRALYAGRPPYEPEAVALRDRAGAPLDRDLVYPFDGPRDDMAHFLRTAGYLFVRGVFGADEVAAFRAECDELAQEARKGDHMSWWGRDATGEEVLCRVTRGASKPRLGSLRSEPRLHALAGLADQGLVYRKGEGDGVALIFKRPGMTAGLGDLPWHRDCGMGGHAVMCPLLIASVYLTDATPETGELAMLPASHDRAFNAHELRSSDSLRPARFHARPGDVSLHYGDTVHAAPPPTSPDRDVYRISAIVGFARPESRHHRGENSYNDVLHQRDDGQVEHLATVAGRK